MANGFSHIYSGIQLVPQNTTSPSTTGDIRVNSSTGKIEFYNGTSVDKVVGETTTATLTNKTLSGNTATNFVNGTGTFNINSSGTITAPNGTDTLTGNTLTQTLTNKTLGSTNTATGITMASFTPDGTHTLTAPTVTDTLVGKATTDILTNKTLSGNTSTNFVNGAGTFNINSTGTITAPNGTDTLAGISLSQTLSNKTLNDTNIITVKDANFTLENNADPTKTVNLLVSLFQTTGTNLQFTMPITTDTLVGRATTDSLTNKTFANATTFTEVATPSNPSAGNLKFYPKTDGNFYSLNSTGTELQIGSSSGGSKNYLGTVNGVNGNGNFETGTTTGWTLGTTGTLTNGLPTGTPTFGSGASGNLSISTVSSGQLAGSYSLSYVSSAATTSGNMVASNAFTIDIEDQAKVLTIKFYYKGQTNPSNADWSGTSTNSFAYAIYDVTNSVWIIPSGSFGMTQSSGIGYVTGTFQTSSNGTQYRLVVYNANASSGAITVYFDDFSVGPQTAPFGPVITDPVSYTPTITGFGTVTSINFTSWRNGAFLFVEGTFTCGTPTATTAQIGLGFNGAAGNVTTINTLPSGGSNWGTFIGGPPGSTFFNTATVIGLPSVSYVELSANNSTNNFSASNGNLFASGPTVMSISFYVPIQGWSSNVQMSNDTDTRVVALNVSGTTTTLSAGSSTQIAFPTINSDTHAAYSSNTYTVPVSGYYDIQANVAFNSTSWTAGDRLILYYKINSGSDVEMSREPITGTASQTTSIAGTALGVKLNANDTIKIDILGDRAASATLGTFSLSRRSGPSVVAATEKIFASYYASSSVSTTANTQINYDTKLKDSHNAVTTGVGAWKFTAPISGDYEITGNIESSGVTAIQLYKNNSSIIYLSYINTANQPQPFTGCITLNAGEYIDTRLINTFNVVGSGTPYQCIIHIKKL